jgi:hypothetical protein
MASKRRMTVWQLLSRFGHRGDRDAIIQHLFEAASQVTFRSDGGEALDGGDYLVEVFESLGTTRDWPPCGGYEWTRLREIAVRRILGRLAREGLLDAVSVGRSGRVGSEAGGMPGAGLAGAGAVAGAGRRPAGREAGGGGATGRDQAGGEGRPEGAARKGGRIMSMYEISLVWRGATYRELIQSMSAERARRAAMERFPGATVLRVARVGG